MCKKERGRDGLFLVIPALQHLVFLVVLYNTVTESYEVDCVFPPRLQMRELRFRETRNLLQSSRVGVVIHVCLTLK